VRSKEKLVRAETTIINKKFQVRKILKKKIPQHIIPAEGVGGTLIKEDIEGLKGSRDRHVISVGGVGRQVTEENRLIRDKEENA